MKIAAVQFSSSADAEDNLSRSADFFFLAEKEKIELLIFPENILYRGIDAGYKKNAHKIPGALTEKLAKLSEKFSVAAIWGGIVEKTENGLYNSSLFFSKSGKLIAKYRKIHLFALYDGEKPIFKEENLFRHGSEIIDAKYNSFSFGFSICYDLRFPELYRNLSARGANVLLVPSDFTEQTGKYHWLPLLQARAIENLSYVIAANQCGENEKTGAKSYGHSCVINPWGKIIAELDGENEGLCPAEISLNEIRDARKKIRALEHRKM